MKALMVASGLAAGLLAAPVWADSCDGAATQVEMTACYNGALKAADKALNATYRQVQNRLAGDPDTKKLLVAAERAWIAFRDAECTFSASAAEGGSAYPMIASICLTDLTRARTRQLDAFLHCEEGDLGCPVPGQ